MFFTCKWGKNKNERIGSVASQNFTHPVGFFTHPVYFLHAVSKILPTSLDIRYSTIELSEVKWMPFKLVCNFFLWAVYKDL